MYKAVLGFAAGVYIGTYYDCKPMIEYAIKKVQENVPEEKRK